jgi:hypothetical protein
MRERRRLAFAVAAVVLLSCFTDCGVRLCAAQTSAQVTSVEDNIRALDALLNATNSAMGEIVAREATAAPCPDGVAGWHGCCA